MSSYRQKGGRVNARIERTLVLIKPDGVQARLVGAILNYFEEARLSVVAVRSYEPSLRLVSLQYQEHVGAPYYDSLVSYMTSGTIVAACLQGHASVATARHLMGAYVNHAYAPGTIRSDLSAGPTRNFVHASDSLASAERELGVWFPDLWITEPLEPASYARQSGYLG